MEKILSIDDLAIDSIAHLADLVGPTGRFVYRYNVDGAASRPGYNILRHCGCVWALAAMPPTAAASSGAREAALRAARWLVDNHVRSAEWGGMCVTERNSVKLGAAGLAVIALLALSDDARGEFTETIDGLCRFMISQYVPHAEDFAHKRCFATGLSFPFRSEYYSGQALFALISAAKYLGNADLAVEAVDILDIMMRKRIGISVQSHWMMYAVHAAGASHPSHLMTEYATAFLGSVIHDDRYRRRGECTPIACRTEALILGCEMLLDSSGGVEVEAVSVGMEAIETNISLQLRDRLTTGAFKRSSRSGEVRIDYVQHNAMSLLGYGRLRRAVAGSDGVQRSGGAPRLVPLFTEGQP